MKKRIFICTAIIALVIIAAFVLGRKEKPVEKKTFETFVSEDYMFSKSMDKAFLYEVETVLNGALDTLSQDSVAVVAMTTVIGHAGEVIFIKRDLVNETADTSVVVGTWVGSCKFDRGEFPYSLADAVSILHDCGAELPHSDKMTLRRPLLATYYKHPMYIFGQRSTGFIYVDAVTGETGEIMDTLLDSIPDGGLNIEIDSVLLDSIPGDSLNMEMGSDQNK